MARTRNPRSAVLQAAIAAWLDNYESPHTRAAYGADLEHFSQWSHAERVNPFALAEAELRRYRAACEADGAGPSTVARRLSAIASFGAFALERGYGLAAPRIGRPTLPAESTTEALSEGDAAAILSAADLMNPRSGLLVRLLMLDGLKVSEAVQADATDVDGRPPHVTLTVHGEAGRVIELDPDTAALLAGYLGRRRGGPLLLSEHRARVNERLTRFGVDYVIKQAAEIAGISGVSGNTLRRRFVTAAHERGEDLDSIRDSLGHADARTTRRYIPQTDSAHERA
jgi:site-specific recombinase XerD